MLTDRLTGQELWRSTATGPVIFLAFSPDGKSVISRDQQGETCTWDAVKGYLEKREKPQGTPAGPVKTTSKPRELNPKSGKDIGSEELRASLAKVKELDFYPVVDRLRDDAINASLTGVDFAQDQQIRQQFQSQSPPGFTAQVNREVLKKASEEGLPLLSLERAQLPLTAARTMDALSKELRQRGFVSVPGGQASLVTATDPRTGKVGVVPQGTSAHAQLLEEWCKQNRIERYSGALNTFLQMLQVEDEPTRMVLVQEVGKIDEPAAAAVLATRAVFDLSPEVRRTCVELLRKRNPQTYRNVLLYSFGYPWAPAADHAAEALVSLRDKQAIPELAHVLENPDPCLPVYDPAQQTGVVRELVRINHMRNCFLCHAVSTSTTDLVRGAVPRVGQPLPRLYYDSAQADFVQANVTYLRQDFSVPQPVDNATPWPAMQRFDYMVRVRKATDPEMAQLKESPAASYPQRNAALTALRSLSGRDLGTSTQAWQKYAADLPLTEGPGKNEEPKDKDEIKLALADKKPQPKDVMVASPDASRFARSNNSTIQILGQNKKTVVATFEAPGRVTALAFAPDGKVLFSTGADKNLTAWSASTGQQIFRVGLGDVPTKLAVSVDGKTVNCTGATFFVEVDASSGKLIRKGTIGR